MDWEGMFWFNVLVLTGSLVVMGAILLGEWLWRAARRFLAVGLATVVFLAPMMAGAVAHGGRPGSAVLCGDGTPVPFVVNSEAHCNIDPQPYTVPVPGGERTMVGFRSVAEMLSYGGMSPVVDWYTVDGTTYVSAANRHHEVLLEIGSQRVRRWAIDDRGVKRELDPLWIDAAPELRNDRTMIPLRAAVESLGAVIVSTDPQINIHYTDAPNADDWAQANTIATGARLAYQNDLITLDDVYFLGDVQRYHLEQMATGNTHWAASIPLQYIRFAVLHDTIAKGAALTDREYTWIGTSSAPVLGHVFSGADIRTIATNGEMGIDIIAHYKGWAEAGYDPYTGRWVDFSRYNQAKRLHPYWNGPDRMYVQVDRRQVIQHYIAPESKATGRPWIFPSRFKENIPFYRQVDNLSQWADTDVSEPFKVMRANMFDHDQLMQMERMTPQEFEALYQEVRFATSPRGGLSETVRAEFDQEGLNYVSMNDAAEVLGAGGIVVVPSEEE